MKEITVTISRTYANDPLVQTWTTDLERETTKHHNDAYRIPTDVEELPIASSHFDDEAIFFHILLHHEEDHNKIVGFIMLSPADHDNHVIWLSQLYIDPAQRGKGIGKEALKLAVAWAKTKDYKTFSLDVWTSNTAAKKAYEKVGFNKVVHETKVMYLTD